MDYYKKCLWLPKDLINDTYYDDCMNIINRVRKILTEKSDDVYHEDKHYQINIMNENRIGLYVDEFLNVNSDIQMSDLITESDKRIISKFGFMIQFQ